jgi:hypothetical protein
MYIRHDFKVEPVLATRPFPGATNGVMTVLVEIPRDFWTEVLTHRRMARNASSKRAQRGSRLISTLGVWEPEIFYGDRKGMGDNDEPLPDEVQTELRDGWRHVIAELEAFILKAERLGNTRQQYNRLLTGAHFLQGLLTATEDGWRYFLSLRHHHAADRAMRELLAPGIKACLESADWRHDEWHIPFWPADREQEDLSFGEMLRIAAARMARISFRAPGQGRDDLTLAEGLISDGHWSPTEHILRAVSVERAELSALNCKPKDRSMGYAWHTYRADLGG